MTDTRKAQLWRELARASAVYRSTLNRLALELDARALAARADELTGDIEVMLETAASFERKPGRVIQFTARAGGPRRVRA